MFSKPTKDMCLQREERVNDVVMNRSSNSIALNTFDEDHEPFSVDPHNVRLGLACDGFQDS